MICIVYWGAKKCMQKNCEELMKLSYILVT